MTPHVKNVRRKVKMSLRSQSCGDRFTLCVKPTKGMNLTADRQSRAPLLATNVPANAGCARRIINSEALVQSVFGLENVSQIAEAIVSSDTVDVIDAFWVAPVRQLPDDAVREVTLAEHSDDDIALGRPISANSPGVLRVPSLRYALACEMPTFWFRKHPDRTFAPAQFSGVGIVIKRSPEQTLRW